MKKLIFIIMIAVSYYRPAFSQTTRVDSALNFSSSVNAQKTANSKDILSNVFRASIDNILGKSKSFQFSSTLYGIDSILDKTARSNIDYLYKKQRFLRGVQINLAVKADSNTNQINSVTGGLTIALINKRDITYAKFNDVSKKLILQYSRFEAVKKQINDNIISAQPGAITDLQKSWTAYGVSHDYGQLDKRILSELKKLSQSDQDIIINDVPYKLYNDEVSLYARKPLLTFTSNYNYNRMSKQSSLMLSSDFLVGLGNSLNGKPWELEAKAALSMGADTSIANVAYKNTPFLINAGVNKVLSEDANKASTLELKGFFQYNYQFGGMPAGTDAGKVTFNTTLRVNLYKSIWLPLTLSYDVKKSNLFGFLSLTADIDK